MRTYIVEVLQWREIEIEAKDAHEAESAAHRITGVIARSAKPARPAPGWRHQALEKIGADF